MGVAGMTPMAEQSSGRVALALQGGGSHGAFTWGVVDGLLEADQRIDAICGVSSGAMIGVMVTQGLVRGGPAGARAAMRRLWQRVAQAHALSPLQAAPLEQQLENILRGNDGVEFIEFRNANSWNIVFKASNPWDKIAEKYPVNLKVKGKVTNLVPYGANTYKSKFTPWAWSEVSQGSGVYAMPGDAGMPTSFRSTNSLRTCCARGSPVHRGLCRRRALPP